STSVFGSLFSINFYSHTSIILSTAVAAAILIASLTWDVSRKVMHALIAAREPDHEMCHSGICWHGVTVRSPTSQVRFRPLAP
ncbi:hypothetical protein PHJA_002351400, partial [Phtheirospermum japonicum]